MSYGWFSLRTINTRWSWNKLSNFPLYVPPEVPVDKCKQHWDKDGMAWGQDLPVVHLSHELTSCKVTSLNWQVNDMPENRLTTGS